MKKNVLSISSTSDGRISVVLNGKEFSTDATVKSGKHTSQLLLPLIETSLHQQKLKLSDLTEITLEISKASFTTSRVIAAIANTLADALKISVNGKAHFVPTYEPSKFD